MKIKALVSFAGQISMAKGEIKEAADERLAASLVSCGYAERVNENETKRGNARKREKGTED